MDNSKPPKTLGRYPRKLSESEWEIWRLYDRENLEMLIQERFLSRGADYSVVTKLEQNERNRHPKKLSKDEWTDWRRYDREHFEAAIEDRFVSKGQGGRPGKDSEWNAYLRAKTEYENTVR